MSSIKDNLRQATRSWAQRGKLRVVNRIRDVYLTGKALRRRSGTAVRSVNSQILARTDGFRVGTTLGYLIAWERGIRAHVVRARNAQALRFKINGVQIFRKQVYIPAQAARPSFGPAFEDEGPHLQSSAQSLLLDAMKRSFPDRTILIGK